MISARIVIVSALFFLQILQINGKSCKLSYGQGNPFPWLIRVWARQVNVSGSRVATAQGALVTLNKVVSPCTALKKLKDAHFSLTGYHFKRDGSYDCHVTQTFFKLEHHSRCEDGNLDADFTLWTLPYPFSVEGQPYLFPFRPTNHEITKAVSNAVTNKTPCELPIFTDAKLESEPEIQRNVHFLPLEEYKAISCAEGNCSQLNSTAKNVGVLYVTRMWNDPVWGAREGQNDYQMGAVLVCDGFPVGMVGVVLPSLPNADREYRYVSSFRNFIDIINPPLKPTATKRRVITAKRGTVRKRSGTITKIKVVSSTIPGMKRMKKGIKRWGKRIKNRRIRKRTTPVYIEDVEAFLSRRRRPSRAIRVHPGCRTRVALMMGVFTNWVYSSHSMKSLFNK